jgi:LDH2 family malate/lactate/ureidoglycolate dehydrogenase
MRRIGAEILERAFVRTLRARGLSPDHADWVAQALVRTSLRGVDTHGIALFPTYRDGIPVDPDLLRTLHQLTEEPALAER